MEEKAPTSAGEGRYKSAQAVVVALLIVGLLTGIFVFQNTTKAEVHFLFWSGSIPLAGGLILAAVLGGLFAFLITFVRQRRVTRDSRALRSREQAHKDRRENDPEP